MASTPYPAARIRAVTPISALIAPLKLRKQLLMPGVYFSDASKGPLIACIGWGGNFASTFLEGKSNVSMPWESVVQIIDWMWNSSSQFAVMPMSFVVSVIRER